MLKALLKELAAGGVSQRRAAAAAGTAACQSLYLDLMQDCLLGLIYEDGALTPFGGRASFDATKRDQGRDMPSSAHTMIGRRRMENIRLLAESVLARGVPGDFMETGVWRGGACIYMRAILKAHGVTDRRVWVADSFQGLPPPDAGQYPADEGLVFHVHQELVVSEQQVKANFAKYGLLDQQVAFLPGWFKDSLPQAPVQKLALLRLDGDMYESTIVALNALYGKLSPGGFIIIDDYGDVPACRAAVTDFRDKENIQEDIQAIDGIGVYWKKN